MATAGLERLLVAVESERQALAALLHRVIVLRLVLEADEHRFVAPCLDEMLEASAYLVDRSRQRTALTTAVAADESANPRLAELAVDAPEPLRWMLTDHHEAIHAHAAEIGVEVERCRRLARAGRDAAEDALAATVVGQSRDSRLEVESRDSRLEVESRDSRLEVELRRQACQGVLAVLDRLTPSDVPTVIVVPD